MAIMCCLVWVARPDLEVASTQAKPSTWWCMDKVLVLSNVHGLLGLIGKACYELVPSRWQQLGVAITKITRSSCNGKLCGWASSKENVPRQQAAVLEAIRMIWQKI